MAGDPCGTITVQGVCSGSALTYCNPGTNTLSVYDCAGAFPGITATCGLVDAEWGNDCLLPTGSECYYEGGSGPFVAFCSAATAGCVIDVQTADGGFASACTENLGDCVDTPDAGFVPSCKDGTTLLVSCNVGGQPTGLDCAPGACNGGVCVGVAGSVCSNAQGSNFVCGSGLQCVVDADGSGTCQPAGGTSSSSSSGAASSSSSSSTGGLSSSSGGVSSSSSSSTGGASSSSSSGGAACGSLGVEGRCTSNTLEYCDTRTNTITTLDCGTAYGVAATCGLVDDVWGYDCLLPAGSECAFTSNGEIIYLFCAGDTAGCRVDPQTADGGVTTACADLGNCTQPATGDFQPICASSTSLVIGCNYGDQPIAYDCQPGTCSNGRCVGTAGALCSPTTGALYTCAAGLTCTLDTDGSSYCR